MERKIGVIDFLAEESLPNVSPGVEDCFETKFTEKILPKLKYEFKKVVVAEHNEIIEECKRMIADSKNNDEKQIEKEAEEKCCGNCVFWSSDIQRLIKEDENFFVSRYYAVENGIGERNISHILTNLGLVGIMNTCFLS